MSATKSSFGKVMSHKKVATPAQPIASFSLATGVEVVNHLVMGNK